MKSQFDSIRAAAEAAHSKYPQYKGHWDDFVPVIVTKRIVSKLGVAFEKDEPSIGKRDEEGNFSVYSTRNGIDTLVLAKHVHIIQ